MSVSVEPVVIQNADGNRLYGMMHRPSRSHAPGVAVVLLSPGIKGRVAPHRLYVKLSRRLAASGYNVLRFDFYGLGDAEGELGETLVADVYGAVSVGRYIDDTRAAIDWLEREQGISHVVLSGLCGGAITGLFAGANDPRIDGLVGFAIPVIRYGNNSMRYQYLSSGEKNQFRRGYLRRLLDWKSWVRLVTLRSDFSVIAKVFLGPVFQKKKKLKTGSELSGSDGESDDAGVAGNLNSYFSPAFFRMLDASKKMLLIFGETDRLYWDFDEKFYQPRKAEIDRKGGDLEIHRVRQARHVFEEEAHQNELFASFTAWLDRHYRHAERDSEV